MMAIMSASVASTRQRLNFGAVRSRASADATVAVEVFAEALLDARQQAGRHLVVAALRGDHRA